MFAMLAGIVIGFLVLGPVGALFGLLIGGFLTIKPKPVARGTAGEGHSPLCGCKKCYRAKGLA